MFMNNTYYRDNETDEESTQGMGIADQIRISGDILASLWIIAERLLGTGARIVDIYMLRRFLDKSYITNAISYTGAAHSANYVEILMRDFGFKITHAAYSSMGTTDMQALNAEIKRRLDAKESIYNLFVALPLQQCSDLTSFPENFN